MVDRAHVYTHTPNNHTTHSHTHTGGAHVGHAAGRAFPDLLRLPGHLLPGADLPRHVPLPRGDPGHLGGDQTAPWPRRRWRGRGRWGARGFQQGQAGRGKGGRRQGRRQGGRRRRRRRRLRLLQRRQEGREWSAARLVGPAARLAQGGGGRGLQRKQPFVNHQASNPTSAWKGMAQHV
jgi:hypothetical protein